MLLAPESYVDPKEASALAEARARARRMSLRKLRKRFASDFWALADQGAVSGFNFLTGVLLARMLGLHDFGVFSLAWLAVLFANSLQVPLVISPMLSIGPQQSEYEAPRYFGTVFLQETLFVALSTGLMLEVMLHSTLLVRSWDVHALALPTAAAAAPYQLQDFLRRYFFTRGKQVAAFVNDLVSYGSQVAGFIVLYAMGRLTSATALYVMGVTSVLALLVGWYWVDELAWPRRLYFQVMARRHWQTSKWLTSSALMQWTSSNLFTIVASAFLGASAAGVLRAIRNIMGVTHIWSLGLSNVVPVNAARRLRTNGVRSMVAYLRETTWIWSSVTLVFAVIVWVAPEFWLNLLYGPAYAGYGSLLRLYTFAYMWVTLALPLNAGAVALEYTVPIFWGYGASSLFSVLSSVPLIRFFGLNGAVLGILGTQVLLQSVSFITLRKRIRLLVAEQRREATAAD